MKRRRAHTVLLLVSWISLVGLFQNCAPAPEIARDERPIKDLEVAIEKTETDLESLAESNRSCTTEANCIAVAVGFKGCGGPRGYTFTSTNNDMAAIEALSQSLHSLERDHWSRSGQASTCDLALAPALICQAGTCQVVAERPL